MKGKRSKIEISKKEKVDRWNCRNIGNINMAGKKLKQES